MNMLCRAGEILHSLALAAARRHGASSFIESTLLMRCTTSRRQLGLFQHHDGITGTARDFVVANYGDKWVNPFDAHCCHMGIAIKHPVPDRVKPSFVIFNIWALWRSTLHRCSHIATMGVKGLATLYGKSSNWRRSWENPENNGQEEWLSVIFQLLFCVVFLSTFSKFLSKTWSWFGMIVCTTLGTRLDVGRRWLPVRLHKWLNVAVNVTTLKGRKW